MDPIQLYVGCAPNGEDAESMMVLEYSAKKHCSMPIEFHYMMMSKDPKSPWFVGEGGWNTSRWPTPFSAFRWGIPWAAGYAGRAIYMDSDMIVQHDLKELWELPLKPGTVAAAKRPDRFCVALWDCAAVGLLVKQHQLPDVAEARADALFHTTMQRGFMANAHLITTFDTNWNNLDGEDRPLSEAKILHYTSMQHQMHLKYALARLTAAGQKHWFDGDVASHWRVDMIALFDRYYNEALAAGYKVETYVPKVPYGQFVKLSQKGYKANHGWDPA